MKIRSPVVAPQCNLQHSACPQPKDLHHSPYSISHPPLFCTPSSLSWICTGCTESSPHSEIHLLLLSPCPLTFPRRHYSHSRSGRMLVCRSGLPRLRIAKHHYRPPAAEFCNGCMSSSRSAILSRLGVFLSASGVVDLQKEDVTYCLFLVRCYPRFSNHDLVRTALLTWKGVLTPLQPRQMTPSSSSPIFLTS